MAAIRSAVRVLALVVAGWWGAAHAGTDLTLGLVLNLASPFGVAATVFAERVAAETSDHTRIQVFPDGLLGGERELVVGVQIGTVDLVIVSTGPVGAFVPATLITDLPFLFRDYDHARSVLDGAVGQDILDQFPSHGLIALAWGENGFRHLTTFSRPVSGPADLKGLTLRTMQNAVHQRAFELLDAVPTPMPFPKLYEALRSHAVDGEENPIPTIVSGGFAEVQRYLSVTGHAYSPALILMAPRAWQALSDGDRLVFRRAAKAAAGAMRAEVDRQDRVGLDALKAAGMTVITDVDRSGFEAALAPAYTEFAKTFGQQRIEQIRNIRP